MIPDKASQYLYRFIFPKTVIDTNLLQDLGSGRWVAVDEAILTICGVSRNLDATVGEVDSVAAGNITVGILVLSLVEAGARVGVLNAVLVLIGLGRELLLLVGRGMRLVGGGSVGRGMVGPGSGGGNSHEGTESDEALK